MIRHAQLSDLPALVQLENQAFVTDRISRRSFRYLLTKAHAATLVEEEAGVIRGYVMLLFNTGTSLARLYSIAVDHTARGHGIGAQLVEAAEAEALKEGALSLRLEVRVDNADSLRLFRRLGYRQIGCVHGYYEDATDALRFEKRLLPALKLDMAKVPYYRQTLEFTCGPASLMMALKGLDEQLELDRHLEIALWRESTTVFMTSGHGGCGPYGLALAAEERGFDAEVFVSDEGVHFIDSVRSDEKKAVIRLVHENFQQQMEEAGVPLHFRPITLEEMQQRFEAGAIPLVLISSYRIYGERFPHWVVVTGFDERAVYVHDPYVDEERGKSSADTINMPILRSDFARMSRYGKSGLRAAVIISRGKRADG